MRINNFSNYHQTACNIFRQSLPQLSRKSIAPTYRSDQRLEVFRSRLNASTPYSTSAFDSEKNKFKVFVYGATGEIGNFIVQAGLNRGHEVVGVARSNHELSTASYEYHQVNEKDAKNDLERIINKTQKIKNNDDVLFVNAVGGAHPGKVQSLHDLNVKSALDLAEAAENAAKQKKIKITFVQLSSIMATLLERDPYAKCKKEADECLIKNFSGLKIHCLRLGYVVNISTSSELVYSKPVPHSYGPEELANMPLQPIVSPGTQFVQPVSISDVTDAIFKAMNADKDMKIINAVGPESLTQENFIGFFLSLSGKKFSPCKIDIDHFRQIATTFPEGHLASYVAEYLELPDTRLDHKPFKQLVGRELQSLSKMYESKIYEAERSNRVLKIFTPTAPSYFTSIKNHGKKIMRELYTNRNARGGPFKSLISIISKCSRNYLSSFLKK